MRLIDILRASNTITIQSGAIPSYLHKKKAEFPASFLFDFLVGLRFRSLYIFTEDMHGTELGVTILAGILSALLVIAFIAFRQIYRLKNTIKDQSDTIRQLQAEQRDKLELVQSTLNPHLLKNVLNSIQSHAYQTYFALDKLANVLDYILYDSRQSFVTVKEEVFFLQNLVEINKIKLSPLFELQVKTKVDEHDEVYTSKIMAPLITIDLIENAFKHADIQNPDSFIKIVTELHNGTFSLTVANKISAKPVLPKEKGGIGTKTLAKRLQLIYASHASLEYFTENDQYVAQLKIKLRDYAIEMRNSG